MPLLTPPPELVLPGLRAMKSVLTVDGPIDATQRALLAFAQRHTLHSDHDIDALAPITPEELAAALPREGNEALRRQFVQGMVMLSLTGVAVSKRAADTVRRYAAALGVDDPLLDHLRQYSEHRIALLRFDYLRRSMPFAKVAERPEGLADVLRTLGHVSGLVEDAALADRYRALGALPEGTLGRALFDFYKSNGFAFPGEKHGAPEPVVRHDLSHVLAGYGVDDDGEAQMVAFQAGYRREGAMEMLVFLAFQVQSGTKLTYLAPSRLGGFDDEALRTKLFRAFRRGAAMSIDPMGDWDFHAVVDRPLEDLRRAYNVLPESAALDD